MRFLLDSWGPLFALFLLLGNWPSFSQNLANYSKQDLDLRPWVADTGSSYNGIYEFGYSENKSLFYLIINEKIAVAQSRWYTWNEHLQEFVDTFHTFHDVQIIGNKFNSKEIQGTFVQLIQDHTLPGLLVENQMLASLHLKGEFGKRISNKFKQAFSGNFPQASIRILNYEDLNRLSIQELKIMRNEIFARYGYIFKQGGEMDRHFRSASWYRPLYKDVEPWLSGIERLNISAIQKQEMERGE